MANIKINLRGDVREYPCGVTGLEVAQSIGSGLAKAACAVSVNGEVMDLRLPITEDCELSVLTFDDPDGKHKDRRDEKDHGIPEDENPEGGGVQHRIVTEPVEDRFGDKDQRKCCAHEIAYR